MAPNKDRKGSGKGSPGKSRAGKGAEESADKNATTRPRDWDVAVSAAYLRSLGQTQEDAAKAVGMADRTLRGWEHSPWWKDAQKEAHERWLGGLVEKTRVAMNDALDAEVDGMNPLTGVAQKVPNDPRIRADMSRYVADRMIAELAPPKQRIAHTASVNPVDLAKLSDEELEQYHKLMEKASNG